MTWDPLLAVEFLTVARLRRWRPVAAETLARAQAFYPLVGLALGAGLTLLDLALAGTLPGGPRAAVLVAALAVATRGLHLDGLADTFDGLLGGRDPAQRLEIMRDPRVGSFGATALVVVLLLKWSALTVLVAAVRRPGLVLAPTLARYTMVVVAAAFPYARPLGMGAGYQDIARGVPLLAAALTATAAALVLLGPGGLALLVLATVAGLAVGMWARARIGGVTGDVYGAACELTETAVLLALVGAQSHGWIAPWLVHG